MRGGGGATEAEQGEDESRHGWARLGRARGPRRRQAALPEASERFRTSYADSPLGLALLTPDGELFHANLALRRLLATAESDLVGRAFLDFVDTEDLVPAEDAIAAPPWAVGGLRSCSVGWSPSTAEAAGSTSLCVPCRLATAGLLIVVHVEDRTAEVQAIAALGHAERVAVAGGWPAG